MSYKKYSSPNARRMLTMMRKSRRKTVANATLKASKMNKMKLKF
jgi:hypothetical protein